MNHQQESTPPRDEAPLEPPHVMSEKAWKRHKAEHYTRMAREAVEQKK